MAETEKTVFGIILINHTLRLDSVTGTNFTYHKIFYDRVANPGEVGGINDFIVTGITWTHTQFYNLN